MLVTYLVVALGLLASGLGLSNQDHDNNKQQPEPPMANELAAVVSASSSVAAAAHKESQVALQKRDSLQGRKRLLSGSLRGRRNIAAISARPYNRSSSAVDVARPFSLYHNWQHLDEEDEGRVATRMINEQPSRRRNASQQRRRLIQQLLRSNYNERRTTSSTTSATSTTTITSTTSEPTTTTTQEDDDNYLVEQILSDDDNPGGSERSAVRQSEEMILSVVQDEASNVVKEGQLRLVNGRVENEGNVEIFHLGEWGSICDDDWDTYDANVVCKQLGYPGAKRHTHSSQFGYGLAKIWMDNMYCYGTEEKIQDCRFEGWGIHDCQRTEAAGVQCKEKPPPPTTPPPTTTPRPKIEIHKSHGHALEVRLFGGRDDHEGRVEVKLEKNGPWGTICGDGWGIREAVVVCKELNLGYAQAATQTHMFNAKNDTRDEILSGVSCIGTESFLSECQHDATNFCPGTGNNEVAAVVCVEKQADLAPDLYALMSSVYLEDKHLFYLQCAMEENCLAREAYRIRRENPNFSLETRRLLRFTTSIANIGDADFRPFIPKIQWQWHSCHMHYHSMEVFAHFDILDLSGNRLAEGHKASFCLEDNDCQGVDPKYDCENYGDQGITPGCKDIYYANIDCQWIDVTEFEVGTYIFKMAINPEYKVAEQTFENNAAICTLIYTQQYASIFNCSYTRP